MMKRLHDLIGNLFSWKQLSSALLHQAELDRAEEELKILHADFSAALTFFKKIYKSRAPLPLYMVIGAPNFGKTTLLAKSGLDLRDIHNNVVHNEFSTKYCVWLFSSQSIFLDTAGIYTKTDKKNAHSNLVWLGFLNLLRGNFGKNPLSGIVVVIDIPTLMGAATGLHKTLNDIKERLYEIAHSVEKLPVFIVFTKADLIAGFDDFFADLSAAERQQLCGINFAAAGGGCYADPQATFPAAFAILLQSMRQRLLQRLQQESDLEKCSNLQSFFLQFASLFPIITAVINEIPYGGHIELHGLYFVSGLQSGDSNDYLMDKLQHVLHLTAAQAAVATTAPVPPSTNSILSTASTAGYSAPTDDDCATLPQPRQQKNKFAGDSAAAYFIEDLFRKELPAAKVSAGANTNIFKMHEFSKAQALFVLALSLLLGGASFSWYTAYSNNIEVFSGVNKILHSSLTQRSASLPLLAASQQMQSLQQKPDPLAQIEQAIIYLDSKAVVGGRYFGLNYVSKFTTLINQAYYQKVAPDFVMRLQKTLEEELTVTDAADYQYLYDTLKTYIMLSNPAKLEGDLVQKWFEQYWQERTSVDTVKARRLALRLKIILRQGIKITPAEQIIATAREILSSHNVPKEDFVYAKLENNYSKQHLVFKFSNSSSSNGSNSKDNKEIHISKLYTADNFDKVYQKQIPAMAYALSHNEGDWVLAGAGADTTSFDLGKALVPHSEMDKLIANLRAMYVKRYVAVWYEAAQQIKIPKFNDAKKMESFLADISNSNYPLLPFIKMMQTNLAIKNSPAEFTQLVDTNLAGWRDVDLKAIYTAFNQLASDFAQIAKSSDISKTSFTKAVARFQVPDNVAGGVNGGSGVGSNNNDAFTGLRNLALRQPQPVRNWLQSIADNSWQITLSGAQNYVNSMWESIVVPEYKKLIDNTYPFFKEAQNSISLQDFAKFFAANGIMDRFFNGYLRPFVDTEQVYWVWKTIDGQRLGFEQEQLEIFIRAALIKKMFYPNGSSTPEVKFTLTTQAIAPNTSLVNLNISGQTAAQSRGQKTVDNIVWPGSDPETVNIEFIDYQNKASSAAMPKDPWAWFRLLDKTNFRPLDKTTQHFGFTIDLNGNAVQYEMYTEQPINPFIPDMINNFRCPDRL